MRLVSDLRVNLRLNEPLAPHTTFKIGGPAHFYGEPKNLTELLYLLKFGRSEKVPVYILGGGSNTLFSDSGFEGLVINMREFEKDLLSLEGVLVTVSAGMSLYHFAKRLQEAGLGGLEFIAQIPGTVGGALVMNAGFGKDETGKRQEISNRLVEVNCLTPEGDFKRLSKKEIQFGYRRSSLKDCLILQAVFELVPRDPQTIQAQMIENSEYRKKGQDWSHPSAGSVFKNPPEGPTVGEMVEKLGLKGLRAGQAQISKIHGNFIVNLGGATAREVLSLIELIREKVRDAYHVELELEICHVGK